MRQVCKCNIDCVFWNSWFVQKSRERNTPLFNLDEKIIQCLLEDDNKRKLTEFHSKKVIANYLANIGEITTHPFQIQKKSRKARDRNAEAKKIAKAKTDDEKGDKVKPVSKPLQSESIKHRKNSDCVSSADMETHLMRTLNKGQGSKSYTGSRTVYNELYQSVEERLCGDVFNKRFTTPIKSPWSGKSLKPIIRQDFETKTLRMKLNEEIIAR